MKIEEEYLFEINLRVSTHAGLPNEIDYPLFAFVLGQVQPFGKVAMIR